LVHRDIKPANIVRSREQDGKSVIYKLIDFGSAIGVDEVVAKEVMMTLVGNRAVAVGTPPYMSPEMFKQPGIASYPTDVWSLGVTMFELVTASLPFDSDSDLLWSFAVAGNMSEKAPHVLDALPEGRRSTFDNNLSKVIEKALEKQVGERYGSADEMHEAVYACLIERGEACYSAFISYRVASEAPLARLLFDELNHSVTSGGHRVTVYWDAHRLVKGEDWETGFASGLLHSLCFIPSCPTASRPRSPPCLRSNSLTPSRWAGRQRH
jgi:serine/threonine protein kinase